MSLDLSRDGQSKDLQIYTTIRTLAYYYDNLPREAKICGDQMELLFKLLIYGKVTSQLLLRNIRHV